MDMTGINTVVESWEKEIDDITKAVEEWSGKVIYLEVKQSDLDKSEKFKKIKRNMELFKENIQKRMDGLRSKIINYLHGIYERATERLEPSKTIVELLLQIKPDLGFLVKIIKAIGDYFIQIYQEQLETIQNIITLAGKVVTLSEKLSNFTPPTVKLVDGTTWRPDVPTMEPITLGDITGGTTTASDTTGGTTV